jgi:hypothetical protein
MRIDMNESTVVEKKVLRKIKQFYKELQYIKVTKKGCCGIEFLEVENPPRQTIYLDEIIFYLAYKELTRTELDFAIQKWVSHYKKKGLDRISFDKHIADSTEDTLYFYELFPNQIKKFASKNEASKINAFGQMRDEDNGSDS